MAAKSHACISYKRRGTFVKRRNSTSDNLPFCDARAIILVIVNNSFDFIWSGSQCTFIRDQIRDAFKQISRETITIRKRKSPFFSLFRYLVSISCLSYVLYCINKARAIESERFFIVSRVAGKEGVGGGDGEKWRGERKRRR